MTLPATAPRTFGLALLAAIALTAAPGVARGDGRALVVVSTDAAPAQPTVSQERLAAIVGEVVSAEGYEVVAASEADVLGLAGCGELSDACLQQAMGLFDVERVVIGEIVSAAGAGKGASEGAAPTIQLRLIQEDGEVRSRSISLEGASAAAIEESFRRGAAAFWRDEPVPEAVPPPEPAPTGPPPPGADLTGSGDRGFRAGQVKVYSWALVAGGVGAAALGGVLLASAADKQEQVDAAPTDTVEDFRALVELEESGRKRARVGNALVIGGSIAVVVGAILVYRQGTRDDEEAQAPRMTITPSASETSVGVSLSWSTW